MVVLAEEVSRLADGLLDLRWATPAEVERERLEPQRAVVYDL